MAQTRQPTPRIELSTLGREEDFLLVARPVDHYLPPQVLDRISRLALLAKSRRERQVVALHLYQGMSFPKVAELLSSTALSVRETLESVCAREAIASRFNRSEEALIRHVPKTKKANKNGK